MTDLQRHPARSAPDVRRRAAADGGDPRAGDRRGQGRRRRRRRGGRLLLVPRNEDGHYAKVGVVASVETSGTLPDGTPALVVQATGRARSAPA